ncbi:GNAT family N-acetyltransferase [Candidatus Nomurabacteria bacterium]|nr:GNAT family N-acetyltransferase [Candidatus Nomurabacteria bacterium]
MNFSESSLEQKEKSPESQTLTREELKEIIYQGERLPQDSRFFASDKGGVFKYFDISDVIDGYEEKYFPAVKNPNGVIVGISEIEKSPYDENIFWIKYISVDPEFREKGYASMIAHEIFSFAQKKNLTLEASSYSSDEGFNKLKPLLNRLADETGVEFIDKGRF